MLWIVDLLAQPLRRTTDILFMSFDHEKLDAYHVAIDLVALASDIVNLMPRGNGHLADQLRRAATSVPLNIAEGSGEYAPSGKARFYRIARRSATECAALVDVCRRLDLVSVDKLDAAANSFSAWSPC